MERRSGEAGSGSVHSGTDKSPVTPPSPPQLPINHHLFSVLNLPCHSLTIMPPFPVYRNVSKRMNFTKKSAVPRNWYDN